MVIGIERRWRQQGLVLTILIMLTGLFVSRAVLSIGLIFFVLLTCVHKNILHQVRLFFQQKFLFLFSLLFFVPFISGLWSTDQKTWLDVVRIKLPLLFFPLAFAGNWQLSIVQWRKIFYFFLLLLLAGCCWSLLQYTANPEAIAKSYLKAKSIPTPFENDHVRFSWVVAIGIAGIVLLLPKIRTQVVQLVLSFAATLFVVYLHLLSARTGLFCFYFFLFAYALHLLFTSIQKKKAVALAMTLALMPLLAWLTLPTFQNRLRYMIYDFSFIQNHNYLPGGNDNARTLSLEAGYNVLMQNAFGVGAGDVRAAAGEWYKANVAGMLKSDQLLPSSEWLVYGSFAGWPGVAVFTIVMLFPLVMRDVKHNFAWRIMNSMAALSFLFDIGLEVQFGVFVYAIVVLCCYKWIYLKEQTVAV